MRSTSALPTLRTAASPNGMTSWPSSRRAATKSADERFTSGTSTGMPIVRHSARYTAALSRFALTLVSSAARYSTG